MTPLSFRRALGLGASAGLATGLCGTLLWRTGLAAVVEEGRTARFLCFLGATAAAWLLEASVLGGAVRQAAMSSSYMVRASAISAS